MPESRTGAAVGGNHQGGPRWRALLAMLAVALIVTLVPAAAWAVPALVPPTQEENADETGAGEVIADGRARLPRGEIVWTIRQIDVPGGEAVAVEEFPLGFALVDEGTIVLRAEDDETPTELAAGEAAFLPDRKAGTLASVGPDAASLYEIALVSRRDAESAAEDDAGEETAVVVGEPFPAPQGATPEEQPSEAAAPEGEEPEAATFEIELVRNTLSGQDAVTIPVSGSGTPVFYLTTDGAAQLQAGDQVVELAAGQFALLAGEVEVRAAGETPTTFVVAAIGEEAEDRVRGERAGREDRQRVRDGSAQADGAPRARRQRAGRTPRVRTGGGGRGGGGQTQQPASGAPGGQPAPGAPTVPTPPAPGTPGVEPTLEATVPVEPTVPVDGTPPPDATVPPATTIPPTAETAVPTEPVPPAETPTPAPTVAVPPTNPPVPPVPGVPTVPPAETVPPEAPPAEQPPVEETPAPPVEEEAAEPAADA